MTQDLTGFTVDATDGMLSNPSSDFSSAFGPLSSSSNIDMARSGRSSLPTAAATGSLQGTVWNDSNRNGQRDPVERGLAGWTLVLDLNTNSNRDPDEPTVVTDANGNYQFSALEPGTYRIVQIAPAGWQRTAPDPRSPLPGQYTVTLGDGETLTDLNFGYRSVLSTLNLTPVASGFTQPVFITDAPDNRGRRFVVEQPGRIRILENGTVLDTAFLDIRDRVRSGGEEGLLSVAFSPNYAENGEFYVYYTNRNGNLVIARYQTSADGNTADASSGTTILTINHPTFNNHNGGQLAFGPDGYLYIGTGDGGSGGDPAGNAQNPNSLLGKILRIDVESSDSAPYTIPLTNPFTSTTDPENQIRDEIWAIGLRNPWRFSFDRATGDLYIADVGQNALEEVNVQAAASLGGENYGWNRFEGNQPYNNFNGDPASFVVPVAVYDHAQGISITGGYVYRGSDHPELDGVYFYGDFANGKIWGLRRDGDGWENQLLLDSPYGISTFGEAADGTLYVADYFGGSLYTLSVPETILEQPAPEEPLTA